MFEASMTVDCDSAMKPLEVAKKLFSENLKLRRTSIVSLDLANKLFFFLVFFIYQMLTWSIFL